MQLPNLPISGSWYTVFEHMCSDSVGNIYKALIIRTKSDGKTNAYVFRIFPTVKLIKRYTEYEKPNSISIAASGGNLYIGLSTREEKDGDFIPYPSITFTIDNVYKSPDIYEGKLATDAETLLDIHTRMNKVNEAILRLQGDRHD